MKGCRPLTDTEVAVVAKSFGGAYAARDRALFVLGVRTVFRISELLSLRVGDVWRHGAIVDRVSVQRKHMKDRREGRTVVLHPQAQAALVAWLQTLQAKGGLLPTRDVFQSREGVSRPISRVQAYRTLQEAYDTNGLSGKLGTHAMRKTFANRVYDALGHDLVKLQRAMGHKHLNNIAAYISFREEEIEAAILAV
jgi:integrase